MKKPVHTVYLDAFYIDKYEVTNAQYKKFMDVTGHKAPAYWYNSNYNDLEQPVVGVDWIGINLKNMGDLRKHPPVKLIIGMITADSALFSSTEELLLQRFGSVDFSSDILPFNYTDYYVKEMGENLLRKFISFEKLIQPEEIVEIKHFTNGIEKEFLIAGTNKRRINLDPGYVTAAKLILATTKDNIHRIYLQDGIFVEITLRVEGKTFRPWQWTYPDYQSAEYIKLFNQIRQMYLQQLRCTDDPISSSKGMLKDTSVSTKSFLKAKEEDKSLEETKK